MSAAEEYRAAIAQRDRLWTTGNPEVTEMVANSRRLDDAVRALMVEAIARATGEVNEWDKRIAAELLPEE